MELVIIITVLGFLLGSAAWWWPKYVGKSMPGGLTVAMQWLHFAAFVFTAAGIWLSYEHNMYFRGFWTLRSIVMVLLFTGLITYPIGEKSKLNRFTKLYFLGFSSLPVILVMVLFIPLIGMLFVFFLLTWITGTTYNTYYNDHEIRVQTNHLSPLTSPELMIYRKEGLIEKHIYTAEIMVSPENIEKVTVDYPRDSIIIAVYEHEPGDSIYPLVVKIKK